MTETTPPDGERSSFIQPQSVRLVSPEGGVPVIYANNVTFGLSYWDLTLDFGLVENIDENEVVVRGQTRVVMSPQHAYVFSQLLRKHVAAYQRQFGPLPTPPNSEELQAEPGT